MTAIFKPTNTLFPMHRNKPSNLTCILVPVMLLDRRLVLTSHIVLPSLLVVVKNVECFANS